jgi:hypothetical protein
LHRLDAQDGHPAGQPVWQRGRALGGHYKAWTTGVVVHMQTLLTLVVVLAIIRPSVVMMVMIAVVIMVVVVVMMVVAMMNMAWLIVCMHVDEGARKCAHG